LKIIKNFSINIDYISQKNKQKLHLSIEMDFIYKALFNTLFIESNVLIQTNKFIKYINENCS